MFSKTSSLAFIGLLSGIAGSLLGLGGGFIVGPLLVTWLGLEVREAISTTLFIVFVSSLFAFLSRFFLTPELFLATQTSVVIVGAVAGAWIGTKIMNRFSSDWLLALFAALLALTAFWVVQPNLFLDPANPVQWVSWNALTIGLLGGLFSGFFGVGGGFWFVPSTHYFLGYSFSQAVVNSLAAVLFSSAISTAFYDRSGLIKMDLVWKIAPFTVAGSILGALAAPWIPINVVKWVFAVLVGIQSLLLFQRVLQHHKGKRFYAWLLQSRNGKQASD